MRMTPHQHAWRKPTNITFDENITDTGAGLLVGHWHQATRRPMRWTFAAAMHFAPGTDAPIGAALGGSSYS